MTSRNIAISKAAATLGKTGGLRKWVRNSRDGKPLPAWRDMTRKGGEAKAANWRYHKLMRIYRRERKTNPQAQPPAELHAMIRDAILNRWRTNTVQQIADALDIHPDTVRKHARIARKAGDPRAASKRPDLVK